MTAQYIQVLGMTNNYLNAVLRARLTRSGLHLDPTELNLIGLQINLQVRDEATPTHHYRTSSCVLSIHPHTPHAGSLNEMNFLMP